MSTNTNSYANNFFRIPFFFFFLIIWTHISFHQVSDAYLFPFLFCIGSANKPEQMERRRKRGVGGENRFCLFQQLKKMCWENNFNKEEQRSGSNVLNRITVWIYILYHVELFSTITNQAGGCECSLILMHRLNLSPLEWSSNSNQVSITVMFAQKEPFC